MKIYITASMLLLGFSNISAAALPNIVVLLADDMGFGEVQALNVDRGKIPTPHLDAMAHTGLICLDAHSGSSVCTPTRYGLMTGRYAWRTRLQRGVLTGGESLIATERLTLPKMLSQRGYKTAMFGKWHLGMLYDGAQRTDLLTPGAIVSQGAMERGGFQQFEGFHHSRHMKAWVQDQRVVQSIDAIDVLPRLTNLAVEFVQQQQSSDQPFFLYVPWNSPHSPVVPAEPWQGRSGLNAHADFVMQTDDAFGQVIDALKQTGQFENTLIVCTSDNGTSAPTSKMRELQALGHFPSGRLRGSKSDIWDGGHRVPMLISWPTVIASPRRTDALICLTDIFATVAEITDYDLPANAGEDSISFFPVLQGQPGPRKDVVHHSVEGQFAIREGSWKLVCCPGSGGWTKPKTKQAAQGLRPGQSQVQLYDLSVDLAEQHNLESKQAARALALRTLLDQQIARGRSTDGPDQSNDVPVNVPYGKLSP